VPYPARVIVVDEYDLPRAGMRGLLSGLAELEVITEASDGHQAVALCRRLRPDLVLMEVDLPKLDGLSAARSIRSECPEARIVIVTQRDDATSMRLAADSGVSAVLRKTISRDELLIVLRQVLAGEVVVDHQPSTRASQSATGGSASAGARLTAREQEVLRLIADGRTNPEIGVALAVSTRTAKAHVERIIARLGVANRAEAVARAIGLGMLTPSAPS
jgi:DNA-binding NarL/FixJ family response regulator